MDAEASTSETTDRRLPQRLFATGHFPNRRLNVYCKLDVLTFIYDKLRDTPEFERIRESCFGKLFDIPLKQCPVSCKLIHALLTRQLVTKQRYVLWTVFGGQPLRFSLEEFGTITGLPCGEFADDYQYEEQPVHGEKVDPYWAELLGKEKSITIADIAEMLISDPEMPSGRKLRLALIMIVDGVLVATHQVHRPTLKYVQMVKDVDEFLQFPWGRESYLKTIACMKPGSIRRSKKRVGKFADPVSVFVRQMQQESFRLQGFAIVLQLLAYRAIPQLLYKIPDWAPSRTLLDCAGVNLPKYPILSHVDVLDVEDDPLLVVTLIIQIEGNDDEGWGKWDDEMKDKKVVYMEELIGEEYKFRKDVWPGGDASEPLRVVVEKSAKTNHKKHIVERRTPSKAATTAAAMRVSKTVPLKKVGSGRKQRHISSYLKQSRQVEEPSNQWLLDELKELREKVTKLEAKTSRQSKKIKRLELRGGVMFSRRLSSVGPRKRRRREPAEAYARSSPPSIRLSGMGSPGEWESGEESEKSSDEFCTHGVEYDGSPVLNQQPPSPLHPSPANEEEDEGTDCEKTEHEILVHGKADHVKTDHVKTDHRESDQGGDDHDETGHMKTDHDEADEDETDHVKTDHDDVEETDQGVDDQAEAVERGADHECSDHVDDEEEERDYVEADQKITDHQGDGEEKVEYSGGDNKVGDREGADHIKDVQVFGESGRSEDMISEEIMTIVREVAEPETAHSKTGQPQATPNPRTMQSPSIQQVVMYSPLAWQEAQPIKWVGPEPEAETGVGKVSEEPSVQTPVPTPREEELVYVSDSSPAKPRERHCPSDMEDALAKKLLGIPTLSSRELLPTVDKELYDLFKGTLRKVAHVEHVSPAEYTFTNEFLLELAKPEQWISTLHMEILVSLANRRHKEVLEIERAIFVSPWLINHIQGKYRAFSKAINKDLHHFDDRISEFVLAPGKTWMKDIHTVYAPMIWDDSHWVGLVLNLEMGLIEILDSQPSLKDAWKVTKLVEPVTHMLPYIISKLCGMKKPQCSGLEPFTWTRVKGIYENLRSGDCGPVAIKFMEIHCNGDPAQCMAAMTDALVDEFRKQYAVDIYKEYVLPSYYPCNSR